jgi:hypothetical protein
MASNHDSETPITVKDVTTTSFGLVIAYLLPGLAGLFSLSFSFEAVKALFDKFATAESNLGLFLLVVLASVAVGLQVSIFRWFLFEKAPWIKLRLQTKDLANLGIKDKHTAFRTIIDEQYRYHQFWGGMTIVQVPLFIGWILQERAQWWVVVGSAAIACVLEICTFWAATEAYNRYITRATALLASDNEAPRPPQDRLEIAANPANDEDEESEDE